MNAVHRRDDELPGIGARHMLATRWNITCTVATAMLRCRGQTEKCNHNCCSLHIHASLTMLLVPVLLLRLWLLSLPKQTLTQPQQPTILMLLLMLPPLPSPMLALQWPQ